MKTSEINAQLKIIKLDGQKFHTIGGYYMPKGFALVHPELGYFAFEGDTPYNPIGGRKALKAILNQGGLLSFDGCKWLTPMKEESL